MVKSVVVHPAEILRTQVMPIMGKDWPVDLLAKDLIDTMLANDAVGIAAPQIGVNKAVCIIGNRFPIVLINPRIVKKSIVEESSLEGCLSLPNINVVVQRPTSVVIETTDMYGWGQVFSFWGPLARIAQHEIDHLNGVLITDYA